MASVPKVINANFSLISAVIWRPKYSVLQRSHRLIWHPSAAQVWTQRQQRYGYSTSHTIDSVDVTYSNGLPVVSVPLPSRLERCQFTLKPVTTSVGDFLHYIKQEDGGVDRAVIYSIDDVRLAKTTSIDLLFQNEFKLVINDRTFHVTPPPSAGDLCGHEKLQDLSEVKSMVSRLYTVLNVDTHQINVEKDLLTKLEDLRAEMMPYEQKKEMVMKSCSTKTNYMAWTGLGLMALQFGFLARLTWWEYSWDIMEPVTYFITYGTSMGMFAYFVLTKKDYTFPDVRDREFLIAFHDKAKKVDLDIEKYNKLAAKIYQAELDLQRLRDPLQMHLPTPQIPPKMPEEEGYNTKY